MPSVLSPPGHAPCSTCPCLLCSIPPVPTWTAPSVFPVHTPFCPSVPPCLSPSCPSVPTQCPVRPAPAYVWRSARVVPDTCSQPERERLARAGAALGPAASESAGKSESRLWAPGRLRGRWHRAVPQGQRRDTGEPRAARAVPVQPQRTPAFALRLSCTAQPPWRRDREGGTGLLFLPLAPRGWL